MNKRRSLPYQCYPQLNARSSSSPCVKAKREKEPSQRERAWMLLVGEVWLLDEGDGWPIRSHQSLLVSSVSSIRKHYHVITIQAQTQPTPVRWSFSGLFLCVWPVAYNNRKHLGCWRHRPSHFGNPHQVEETQYINHLDVDTFSLFLFFFSSENKNFFPLPYPFKGHPHPHPFTFLLHLHHYLHHYLYPFNPLTLLL